METLYGNGREVFCIGSFEAKIVKNASEGEKTSSFHQEELEHISNLHTPYTCTSKVPGF